MKPLKRKMQMAMGGKKRKFKSSLSSSKNNKRNNSSSKNYDSKNTPSDTTAKNTVKDTIIDQGRPNSLALMDTVIRIYYQDLTDSILNRYKAVIKSFVNRTGRDRITDISLTDFYSEDGFTDASIKSDIEKYLMAIGVSKHRLFWRKNRRVKLQGTGDKPKKLLYVEIGFH